MFDVKDLITCKKESSDFFIVTNSHGSYEIVRFLDCAIDTDGTLVYDEDLDGFEETIPCAEMRVIEHADKSNEGMLFVLPLEELERHFERVSEEAMLRLEDAKNIVKGWEKYSDITYDEKFAELKESMISFNSANLGHTPSSYVHELLMSLICKNKRVQFNKYKCSHGSAHGSAESFISAFQCSKGQMNVTFIECDESSYDRFYEKYSSDLVEIDNICEFPKFKSFEYKVATFVVEDAEKMPSLFTITNNNDDRAYAISVANILNYLGYSEERADVIDAIKSYSRKSYFEAINPLVKKIHDDIEREKRKEMFSSFGGDYTGSKVGTLESSISSTMEYANSYLRQYSEYMKKAKDLRVKLFFAKHGKSSDDEFVEFINSISDKITEIRMEGIVLCAVCRTYMAFWEDDLYDTIVDTDYGFDRLSDKKKFVMNAIFKDRSVKLRIEQGFRIDMEDGEVGSYRSPNGNSRSKWGIPNPHINEFSCFGDHSSIICECVNSGDIMAAYSQAVSACSGIDWADSVVSDRFIGNYSGMIMETKCIELSDGRCVTGEEYYNENA